MIDVAAEYDRTTNTSTLTLANVDGSYLMQLVSSEVAAYKVSLPSGEPARVSRGSVTATATIVTRGGGVQSLSVGLSGSLTLVQIAQRYGLPWGAPEDLITVSNPSLVYTRLPASLGATMVLDIPSLGVAGLTASLLVKPGGGGMQAKVWGVRAYTEHRLHIGVKHEATHPCIHCRPACRPKTCTYLLVGAATFELATCCLTDAPSA